MSIGGADGSVFGMPFTINSEPHRLEVREIVRLFEMFADFIGQHLTALERATLLDAHRVAALHEQFIVVLEHDLRNPLTAIDGGLLFEREHVEM